MRIYLFLIILTIVGSSSCGVQSKNFKITDCEMILNSGGDDFFSKMCKIPIDSGMNLVSLRFAVTYYNGRKGIKMNSIEPGLEGVSDSIKYIELLVDGKVAEITEMNCLEKSLFAEDTGMKVTYFRVASSLEKLQNNINGKVRDFTGVRIKDEQLFLVRNKNPQATFEIRIVFESRKEIKKAYTSATIPKRQIRNLAFR